MFASKAILLLTCLLVIFFLYIAGEFTLIEIICRCSGISMRWRGGQPSPAASDQAGNQLQVPPHDLPKQVRRYVICVLAKCHE